MKHFKMLSTVAFAALFFLSCGNSRNKELTVPKDASMVIHINGASINSKANWNDLLNADGFRREKHIATDSFDKQLMEDPEKSGVELNSDLIYFTHKRDFIKYSVFEGRLRDISDFEKFLKEKNPGKKTEDGGDFSYIAVDKSDFVTWTKSKFIYISGEQTMGAGTSVSADSLKEYAASIYKLKKQNSIETNEKYSSLLKEKGDIHFWSSTADVLSNFQFGPVPLIAASAMMQGSITAGTVNFENGKIVITSKQYLNATLSKLIENYTAKPLTPDLLNHISEGASIVIAASYHPQLIKDFLKVSGTESTSNQFLEGYNLTFDELLQSTNGELLITASELGPQGTVENDEEADDIFPFGGNLLFATSLKNDEAFKKAETIIRQTFPEAVISTQNNWFLVGNTTATINHFFSTNTNTVIAQKLGGHPLGVYIDIEKGLKQWNVHGLDSALLQQIDLSKKFWRDIVSTGGEMKNGSINFETNVNLADKSTNSLKQLADYSRKMSSLVKKDQYVKRKTLQKSPFLAYNF